MADDNRHVEFRGLTCEVSEGGGGVRVAMLGEIDISIAADLGTWLHTTAGDGALVLDLGGVDFMDSTGLHMLIKLKRNLEGAGGSFRLGTVSEPVGGLLQVSGLTDFFERSATR